MGGEAMKIKTAELTGPALDWAVAIAKGVPPEDIQLPRKGDHPGSKRIYRRLRDQDGNLTGGFMSGPEFLFSSKWEAGGPIIESIEGLQQKTWLISNREGKCQAEIHNYEGDWVAFGPTPLIAAMRCFVASKLGDEVDVPEELLA